MQKMRVENDCRNSALANDWLQIKISSYLSKLVMLLECSVKCRLKAQYERKQAIWLHLTFPASVGELNFFYFYE